MPAGGFRHGSGRKKSKVVTSKPKDEPILEQRDQIILRKSIRQMMEDITPGNEPVPVLLLRIGYKLHNQGLYTEAISAIARAMEYGYGKMKQIELIVETKAPTNGPVVILPSNNRD